MWLKIFQWVKCRAAWLWNKQGKNSTANRPGAPRVRLRRPTLPCFRFGLLPPGGCLLLWLKHPWGGFWVLWLAKTSRTEAAILGILRVMILMMSNRSRKIGLEEYWEHRGTPSAPLPLESGALTPPYSLHPLRNWVIPSTSVWELELSGELKAIANCIIEKFLNYF